MTPQDKAKVVIAFAVLAVPFCLYVIVQAIRFFNELSDDENTNWYNS